ncbi:SDR family NAD(P)-dependent oxidoreductase [Eggerthellaceae bacterium 3-80]|nr:SDR family NAD(P)-dependent oxidoreductase [bacterium D16-34]
METSTQTATKTDTVQSASTRTAPQAAPQAMPQTAPQAAKRIAFITGASSGIGKEFAIQIDRMQVVDELWLCARNADALEALAAKLDTPVRVVCADLTDRDDIEAIREKLVSLNPQVTYLVNAAGFGKFGDWQSISSNDVDAMIDLNCKALVDVTQMCLPFMGRGGHIIEVASAAAFAPLPHLNVYAASKAFVLHYSRGLRFELRGRGIALTALCPTWVKTNFEQVARQSGGAGDVGHLLGEQSVESVVRAALFGNKMHAAVVCASPQSFLLRLVGKVVPNCITMAGWDILRHI